MSKVIIRIAVGGLTDSGFCVFRECIYQLKKLYPDFQVVILCNNITQNQMTEINNFGVIIINQYTIEDLIKPVGALYNLLPLRLDDNAYEIFMDSDIVLTNSINKIFSSIKSNECFCCLDVGRFYGNYDSVVGNYPNINTGLFGIPPKFPLFDLIKEVYDSSLVPTHWDYQGLVAYALTSSNFKLNFIDNTELSICMFNDEITQIGNYHFIGINRKDNHRAWNEYQLRRQMCYG